MIDKRFVDQKVRNRGDWWHAMVSNHYHVPDKREQMCTLTWMQGVVDGKNYCPMAHDITEDFRVSHPPTKLRLRDICYESLLRASDEQEDPQVKNAMRNTAIEVKLKPPNTKWMVDIIGLFDPDTEIFEKDYTPPPRVAPRASMKYEVPNRGGFFDNLPVLPPNLKKGRALAMPRD